jgi:hypothetical protein
LVRGPEVAVAAMVGDRTIDRDDFTNRDDFDGGNGGDGAN